MFLKTSSRSPAGLRQEGVTLVEVLIAVLVLSVGLLGVAGLQGTSLRNSYSAYQRSQAVSLGYEVIDALRAAREQVVRFGIPPGFVDTWEDQVDIMLTDGAIDVDVVVNGTARFARVSIAWLDDRSELDTAIDCAALASASAEATALSTGQAACTRLSLESEL